jgi:hypothetical protein
MRRNHLTHCREAGYPFLEDESDPRIFQTPTPLENFMHIALGKLTLDEWQEATRPRKDWCDIQYPLRTTYSERCDSTEEEELDVPAASVGGIQDRGGQEPAVPAAPLKIQRENVALLDDSLQVLLSFDSESEFTGVTAAVYNTGRGVLRFEQLPPMRGRAARRDREQQLRKLFVFLLFSRYIISSLFMEWWKRATKYRLK